MGTVPEIDRVINSTPDMIYLGHAAGGEGEGTRLALLLAGGLIT